MSKASAQLNSSEITTGITFGFFGPLGATAIVAGQLNKIGSMVFLEIEALAAAAGGASFMATATAAIPAAFRPSATLSIPLAVTSNSATLAAPGSLEIQSGGDILIYATLTKLVAFSGSGNNGWSRISTSYHL